MSRFKLIACAVLSLLALSCSMDRKSNEDGENQMVIVSHDQDDMTYGILLDAVGDDSLLVDVEDGDSLWIRLKNEDSFVGEIVPGSRVVFWKDSRLEKVASYMLNVSMLMGEWVEPSALAEGSFTGMQLNDGGMASSINSQTTDFESWRLVDRKLLLMSVPKGLESDEQMIDTFEIAYLTVDSLVLQSQSFKHYFCRQGQAVLRDVPPAFVDADDRAGDYDLFNPEGDAPNEEKSEDGLMY